MFESIADGAEFVEIGAQSQARARLPAGFSLSAGPRAHAGARAVAAASGIGCCSRDCSRDRSTCSCSTSRRTISTSRRSTLLEELLLEFSGTLLVVSHDREFLDHVVTSTLVLEGRGRVGEYVGGYTDWVRAACRLAARCAPRSPRRSRLRATKARAQSASPVRAEKKRKLTFKETNELASLPASIDCAGARARRGLCLARRSSRAPRRRRLAAAKARARRDRARDRATPCPLGRARDDRRGLTPSSFSQCHSDAVTPYRYLRSSP